MINLARVIQWVQLAILIWQFGSRTVALAVDIYYRIEHYSEFQRLKVKEPMTGKEKAGRFARLFIAEYIDAFAVAPPPSRVVKLREGVWKTRPENAGRKPGRK